MARDVRFGRAFIELFLKDEELVRELTFMKRSLSAVGVTVAKVGAAFTALGIAAGTAAAAGIIKATNAAGDFAETVSKFETVFGERANPVREWAEETAEALGITRQEILSTLSSFQDLFVPLGIDAMAAEQMSMQLAQLAVDLASFNNMASSDVVRDLQAAMTGSSETMKKYGAIVNQTAVNQELLNRELDPKEATEAEKAMVRLDLIMRSTTAAQGDAIRTADSYNNSLKRIRTAINEAWVELGQKFLPALEGVGTIGVEAFKQLRMGIRENIPQLERLDEVAIKAAKEGRWDLAGEIIGKQMALGIRSGIGPTLYDVLFRGIPLTFRTFAAAGLQAGVPTTFRAGIDAAGRALALGGEGGESRFGQALAVLQQQETQRMRAELQDLVRIAEKQLEEDRATREAIENGEGLVFQ